MKLQVCRCALVFLKRAALFSFRIPDCRLRKACNNRLSQYKSAQCTLTWTWREARRDFTQRVKQDSLIRKRQMFFLSWRAIALSFVLSPTPLNRWPSHSLEIKSWICSYLETLGWLSCTNNGEWDDWYDRMTHQGMMFRLWPHPKFVSWAQSALLHCRVIDAVLHTWQCASHTEHAAFAVCLQCNQALPSLRSWLDSQ